MKLLSVIAILWLIFVNSLILKAQPPREKHVKLEISKNGHYIQHEDAPPLFWIGDTGWGLFQHLAHEDVDRYLDSRQSLCFQVIQAVVHRIPNGNVISGTGEGESLKTAVTKVSSDMALEYYSNNSYTRINNILNKNAKAYWFYPRDGKTIKAGKFKKNESRYMIPPANWENAILVRQAIE